jgi:site-specific DNA-methyltransferase (adenine-specific)
MKNNPLPRLDTADDVREQLLPFCRLSTGKVWEDEARGHRVACIDSSDASQVGTLMAGRRAALGVHDPPYNQVAFGSLEVADYVDWCQRWIRASYDHFSENASLYVWLGADQNDGFQPLADFMVMMRSLPFKARSFITMRNQRGYGTQGNWMAVRQELLYYVKGRPAFDVNAEYTDIPKILRGYYKEVNGQVTENLERSRAETIRAGNVWVDVQQVFYRMEENVSGCYAQKPLKAVERIIQASSAPGEVVLDLFAHSGTTLLAAERLNRTCLTADIDPVFCEISIRRLEHFRTTGRLGWQNGHAFEAERRDFQSAQPVDRVAPSPQSSLF